MFQLKNAVLALSVVASGMSMSAYADTTVYGSNFGTGSTYATQLNGVATTFSAYSGSSASTFTNKSQGGYTGAGVAGGGTLEINIGESIKGSFASPITISNFTLGLLFDGPEYGDVNEVAQISATYADNSVHTFTFTATGSNTAVWTGSGSFVNLSAATEGAGAVWSLSDPFGGAAVKSIAFTALKGACGSAGGACNNQSDYTLISVSAVPEPESYAMMLAGLGLMGFVASRRKG